MCSSLWYSLLSCKNPVCTHQSLSSWQCRSNQSRTQFHHIDHNCRSTQNRTPSLKWLALINASTWPIPGSIQASAPSILHKEAIACRGFMYGTLLTTTGRGSLCTWACHKLLSLLSYLATSSGKHRVFSLWQPALMAAWPSVHAFEASLSCWMLIIHKLSSNCQIFFDVYSVIFLALTCSWKQTSFTPSGDLTQSSDAVQLIVQECIFAKIVSAK